MSDEPVPVDQAQPVEPESVEPDEVAAEPTTDPRTHRFECRSCGYVYDPDEGVKKVGIAAGTAFAISIPEVPLPAPQQDGCLSRHRPTQQSQRLR